MRVLIVDDDAATAELTAECLMMNRDIIVQIALDDGAALRATVDFAPDAILLDVQLAGTSGLDLAVDLKVLSRGRARIIVFSGTVSEYESGPLPPGVDAWLSKPAHLDELHACISAKP
ncbi:response regulator transcription factor [Achromobacter piechaudii]|uniref:response regulator transcription factor n=1 Tax=Achromobacter piechaudii TaxID=72556 RepID=UPI003DA99A13